jgi:hypothetical protein
MRKIPPLNAMKAFEAAGRHTSFTRAAEELNVSQGAISKQVAVLEEWLGTSLFTSYTIANQTHSCRRRITGNPNSSF